jgi:hypothetical protein
MTKRELKLMIDDEEDFENEEGDMGGIEDFADEDVEDEDTEGDIDEDLDEDEDEEGLPEE